ncbi:hypothetical protein K0M31_018624, partial [Melipona bicolor]
GATRYSVDPRKLKQSMIEMWKSNVPGKSRSRYEPSLKQIVANLFLVRRTLCVTPECSKQQNNTRRY